VSESAYTPQTRVKAFNTMFADVLRSRVEGAKVAATVLVASDDEDAKRRIISLAGSFGFEAIDAGRLSNARYLEPVTELLIQLAYGMGMGRKIGVHLVKVASA
jgi:8-hydroxy-5-deazaflavin:NADPH oxidoreductase